MTRDAKSCRCCRYICAIFFSAGANFFVAKYASVLFKSLFATLLNNNTFTIMVIPGYIENLQSCDLKFWISPSMVILPVFAFNVSSILCHSPGNILWWLQNKFQRHQNFMPLITEEIPSDKGRPELLARNLTLKFTNQSYNRLRFYNRRLTGFLPKLTWT